MVAAAVVLGAVGGYNSCTTIAIRWKQEGIGQRIWSCIFVKKEQQLSTKRIYFCLLQHRFSVATAGLTIVAVLALITRITAAGIVLELVHARSMLTVVGLTLVPV